MNKDVEAAEALYHVPRGAFGLALVIKIRLDHDMAATRPWQARCHLLRLFRMLRGADRDARALGCESLDDAGPYAAGATGHVGALACKDTTHEPQSFPFGSARRITTINRDGLSCDEGSEVAGQVHGHLTHLLHLSAARDRMHATLCFQHCIRVRFLFHDLEGERRLHETWTHRVDAYALFSEVECG